jgi:hypothetical protein
MAVVGMGAQVKHVKMASTVREGGQGQSLRVLVCNGGLCADRCKQWLSDAAWVSETTYVRKMDLEKLDGNWPISATHVFTHVSN